jgi:hypothetical protein
MVRGRRGSLASRLGVGVNCRAFEVRGQVVHDENEFTLLE